MRPFLAALVLATTLTSTPSAQLFQPPSWLIKLEPALQSRLTLPGQSPVIVRAVDHNALGAVVSLIAQLGGTDVLPLPVIDAQAARLPNVALAILAASPLVAHISIDRGIVGANERTGVTVGAVAARQEFGFDGAGIGIAIVDSGVAAAHDDLREGPGGPQRVRAFVDFVNGQTAAYDDYGHGTHVAGIVAGSGFDSDGRRSGIAPGADLVVLKALDGSGSGRISKVIAALGWAVVNRAAYNIRVVNLSIASGVYESYTIDPLTLAARAAVTAGIVVVAAAGNNGRSPEGEPQYGGVTAPGNAPWVLTVGASSHMGTTVRADDTMALFSSRGPTAIDRAIKPDLVAPGVGTESLSDPDSLFYATRAPYLLPGSVPTTYLPYLSLSGTSMAAPVVAGTVALMLQANAALTPNQVKTLLEYTAEPYPSYDAMTQGAGFLNTQLAVEMARFFWSAPVNLYPPSIGWGRSVTRWTGQSIVWSAHATSDGDTVVWGTSDGDTVVWGTDGGDTVVWGTSCSDPSCQPIVWQ